MKRQVQRNQNICITQAQSRCIFHNMCNVTLFAKPFIIPENLTYIFMLFLSMFTFSEPNAIQIIKEILYLMSYRSFSNAIKNDASNIRREATRKKKEEEVLLSHISSLIILIKKNKIKRHR